MKKVYPNIANLLRDYHDVNCVCGINHDGTATRGSNSGIEPFPSVASKTDETMSGSLEKPSTPENGVSFSVKLERGVFSVHSILMVMVLVLSMSSMWVSPWDVGRQGQGKEEIM